MDCRQTIPFLGKMIPFFALFRNFLINIRNFFAMLLGS